jgi:protein disulfide-isomerase A1
MQLFYIFALVALLAVAFVRAEVTLDEGVLVLTEENFDGAIADNNLILVEFYAPWCGHCKNLAPEYVKAAAALKDEEVKLAKVDATEHKELGSRFGVQGFPTLKFFKNGKPQEYTGGRTSDEIVTWLKKKSGPATISLTTEDDLLKAQEANEVVVVGVFASADSAEAKTFTTVAAGDDSLIYALTTSAAVKSKLSAKDNSIALLKDFDELRADFDIATSTTAEQIAEFVTGASVPLIQTFSQESSQKIFKSDIHIHNLFFTKAGEAHHDSAVEMFTGVAKKFRGKAMFINVPHSESRVLDYFGFKESDLPTYVLADMGGKGAMKKYKFEGAFEADAVTTFVNNFFDGKLKPTLKSEAPAPEDTAGDVFVVKGSSFNEIVLDNTKDVLVEFYAPWCGHCKNLAPIYDELGAKFKDDAEVVIAKMDATANEIDVAGVEVSGFPTLYFFPGNEKASPKKYEGGRDLDGFVEYLKKNAHNKHSHSEL